MDGVAFYHLILGRKKAGDLFQISCSVCRYVGGGYLIVKVRGKLTRCEADTAEDRLCIERKNKQAVQGLLYVRFICFGNGNLVAAHDDSDGFWRRQILITVKDRDPARVDNPFLIEELSEERPGILLWMLEGLHRLLAMCRQMRSSLIQHGNRGRFPTVYSGKC